MENLKTKEIDIGQLATSRAARGFTLEQVAEKVGVKRQTVSNYEQGHALPSANIFARLCALYDLDPKTLLKDTESALAK